MENTSPKPEDRYFDGYEIHPVRESANYMTQCEPEEADYWTLYGHYNTGGLEAIGDFKSEESAQEILQAIEFREKRTKTYLVDLQDSEEQLWQAIEDIHGLINRLHDYLTY